MKKSIIQKVLSMILAVLLMLSIIPMSGLAQSSVAFRYGDVTGDGAVDAKDALEVLQAAVNKITLNEQQTKAGDVDGNGTIDAKDALLILQYTVGKITKFPVEVALEEADKAAAQAVDSKITAIGVVTLDSEAAITEARAAYDSLTDAQKEFVTKFDILVSAEATLAQLKAEPTVFDVYVTDEAYGAKGDSKTNDRAAIQAAIDDAHAAGGGTVRLDAGKTFVSGNLLMRSNVTLVIEEGAKLLQSGNPKDFVDPLNNFESKELVFGTYVDTSIQWNAAAFYNYPLIYAGDGTKNIKITGKGTIEMNAGNDSRGAMTMQAIGLFQVDGYELSEFTVRKYYAYCIKAVSCSNGLCKNLTIDIANGLLGGTDGINLNNCQNIRVTGCRLNTGDDGVYIASAYRDPREGLWYNNENPLPSNNIEIDNNYCEVAWDETKAFCFIMWGAQFPDQKQVEVSDVYIHDNYFETIGAWTGNWNTETHMFDFNGSTNAMKNIRFENNEIGSIQGNFYSLPISDVYGFDCMTSMRNGDFSQKDIYWVSREGGSSGYTQDGYGYIDGLDKADAALYQGIKLSDTQEYCFKANVQTSGDPVRLFVKNQTTGELIASKEISNTQWEEAKLTFQVPATGNYHMGIEKGNAAKGWANIDDAQLVIDYGDVAGEPDGNTILTTQTPDTTGGSDGLRNALGVRFGTTAKGKITKVRLYTTAKETGIHYVSLWNYQSGELLTEEIYTWNIIAGYEGWREFTLPTPVSVKPNVEYVVSVTAGDDCSYQRGIDQFASSLTNGYLYTFANSGVYSANANVATTTMPAATTASNYFRDVVFVVDENQGGEEPPVEDAFGRNSQSIVETTITTYGRTYSASEALYFNWTMSGFSFEIDGTDAYANFDVTKSRNRNVYVNVYVDDETEPHSTLCLTDSGDYLLARGLPQGKHTIKVLKRSEASIGTVAVRSLSSSGRFTNLAPEKSSRTIEVIGDSITAGFGNLVTNGGSGAHTSYEQDGTRTYATMAGERLGADVTTISASGIGCRYIGNGPDCVMQDIYPYVDGLNLDTTTVYDFDSNPSDVVVISLGTNDVGWASDSELVAAVEEMITLVREKNPDAVIIWCYGMMVTNRANLFQQAVNNIQTAGDNKVYYLQLPQANTATEGVGVGNHPTLASHLNASKVLADFIAEVTGWNFVNDTVSGSEYFAKSALFVGDSISFGANDTPYHYAWANRLADNMGLIATNKSEGGWALTPIRGSHAQIVNQFESVKNKTYHYVIMQGGVNDAGSGAPVGAISDGFDSAAFDTSTFAGALENLFYTAKTYFPEAALGYIINYQLPLDISTDMGIYYDTAIAICEKWEIPYLDLHHNDYITDELIRPDLMGDQYNMDDEVHLNHNGYDALTPYIKAWFKTLIPPVVEPEPDPDPVAGETIFTTQTPSKTVNVGGIPNGLGTLFSTKVNGTITHVRLYTSALETGVHYVALWDYETGTLVSEEIYQWTPTEGVEGWQVFALPTPVAVTAGTKYVVSVTCGPDAVFMSGTNQLASPIENGNLITYENSGMYTSNANLAQTTMPDAGAGSNYFRDVIFVTDEEPVVDPADQAAAAAVDEAIDAIGTVTLESEATIASARSAYDALSDAQKALVTKLDLLVTAEQTLKDLQDAAQVPAGETIFTTQTPSKTVNVGGIPNGLGTLFSTKVNGTITHVRLYTSALETGVHYVALWDYETGTLVSEEIYQWTPPEGVEGWQVFELPTPVAVTAGTKYVVSVTCGPDAVFMSGTNQLASPVENGNLITYENSGMYTSNAHLAQTTMPDASAGSNYFRDVMFVAASE